MWISRDAITNVTYTVHNDALLMSNDIGLLGGWLEILCMLVLERDWPAQFLKYLSSRC